MLIFGAGWLLFSANSAFRVKTPKIYRPDHCFRKNDFLCGNRYSQIPDHSIFLNSQVVKITCNATYHTGTTRVTTGSSPIPVVPLFLFIRRFSRRLSNTIREYVMSVLNHISLHT
jgi:hypothetical protein